MNFQRVPNNGEYRSLRLLSIDGNWELGMSPYAYGMRLRMGRTGRPPQVMDFCMGKDSELFSPVLLAVLKRLEDLDESANGEEINSHFPWGKRRPDLSNHLTGLLNDKPVMN